MRLLLTLFLALFVTSARSQNPGDSLFSAPVIHDVNMTFYQTNFWDSLIATHTTETYISGIVAIDGQVIGTCGVKTKGNSSFNNPSRKKSFKVDFNEFVSGQNFDGLKKINLNNGFKDPTFMREKLALDFYNEHGMAAPRCTYARVFLNGVYWGLYMLVEEADSKEFLEDRFNSSSGNCFKGDPTGDLRWMGSTPSLYYSKYELCTNEFLNDWTDLIRLINVINNSGTRLYDSLENVLNTSSFISQWAMMNVFSNFDSYLGSGHNYYMYHDPISNKFEWIAWDVNEAFGTFRMNLSTSAILNMSYAYVSTQAGSRPLVQNMITDLRYRNALRDTICRWIQNDFSNATLNPKIDSLASIIRPHVYADSMKFYTNQNFETNLTTDITGSFGLKSFITSRRNALLGEVSSSCFSAVQDLQNQSELWIYPQPTSQQLHVDFINAKQRELYIYNMLGEKIIEQKVNEQFNTLDLNFSPGIYLLVVSGISRKIIITD